MARLPDPIDTVGWHLRFDLGRSRYKDVYVWTDDQHYAIERGRRELELGNDSPFPTRTPLDEKGCGRVGLKPGMVVVK